MRPILFLALLTAPAAGSSPAAWRQGNAAARTACLRVAGLDRGARTSAPIAFSDTAGQTALLVTGASCGRACIQLQMLCLYDRKAKHAEVSEAKGWHVP